VIIHSETVPMRIPKYKFGTKTFKERLELIRKRRERKEKELAEIEELSEEQATEKAESEKKQSSQESSSSVEEEKWEEYDTKTWELADHGTKQFGPVTFHTHQTSKPAEPKIQVFAPILNVAKKKRTIRKRGKNFKSANKNTLELEPEKI
jgi:hypothetical protein